MSSMSSTEPRSAEELLFEDDELRVLRISLPPGASLLAPTEAKDHFLCVLDGGRVLVSGDGATAWDLSYQRGQTAFLRREDAASRGYGNRGEEPIRFLRVELKS